MLPSNPISIVIGSRLPLGMRIFISVLALASQTGALALSSRGRSMAQSAAASEGAAAPPGEGASHSASGIWDADKPIPVDPVMDFDFTRDDDNPLENIYERPFNVSEKEEALAHEKLKNATSEQQEDESDEQHEKEEKEKESQEAEENQKNKEMSGVDREENETVCATKFDERASSWFGETAPAGTPCMFGVDLRDEGSHCVDEGSGHPYGSYGWCYTNDRRTQWGSCNEHCPLFGQTKILGEKIDAAEDTLGAVKKLLNESMMNATTDDEALEVDPQEGVLAGAPAAGLAAAPAGGFAAAPAAAQKAKVADAPAPGPPPGDAAAAAPAAAGYLLQARSKVLEEWPWKQRPKRDSVAQQHSRPSDGGLRRAILGLAGARIPKAKISSPL